MSFFEPLKEVGATDYNGTTNADRTNYFQTVPRAALDRALFLESDRMGYLLGAVTQAKVDAQRGVVQNEKRQGDTQPYGLLRYKVVEGLFPPGHPYHHSTIGSMADLDAASLEDVSAVRRMAGQYETAGAVLGAMQGNDFLRRPDDYQDHLAKKYRALTIAQVDAAARKAIDPRRFIWVVVGDASKVRPQLDSLGLPVEVVSAAPAPGTAETAAK